MAAAHPIFGAVPWRPPGWEDLPEGAGGLPLTRLLELETAWRRRQDRGALTTAAHAAVALLRQCWLTPAWVWDIARAILGPEVTDPFWNPQARTRAAVKLTGPAFDLDGYDLRNWDGTAFVNGPHSDPARWLALCAQHAAAGHAVAAVVGTDHTEAIAEFVWGADAVLWPDFRLAYDPPFGLPRSSPTRGSLVALWHPGMGSADREDRLAAAGLLGRSDARHRDPGTILTRIPRRPGAAPTPSKIRILQGRSDYVR